MASIVKQCKVISNFDPTGCGRILVYLNPEDSMSESKIAKMQADLIKGDKKDTRHDLRDDNRDETSFAFPLLPKNFYVVPKVNEYVFVLNAEAEDGNSQRYYIGPIVPQMTSLYDSSGSEALSALNSKKIAPSVNPAMISECIGVLPNDTDVSIEGRKNCSVQLTDNDVRIKAGVKKTNVSNPSDVKVKFNEDNTKSYVMLRYNEDPLETPVKKIKYQSSANIVADKINLLGNTCKYNNDIYKTNDNVDLIKDEDLLSILDEAHQLPYGDKLVNVLQKFWDLFKNHSHEWIGEKPRIYTGTKKEQEEDSPNFSSAAINAFDEEMSTIEDTMLSDNIRIN